MHVLLFDRRRRQQGGVLSALLIIVAMGAILLGALMTQLSSAFVATRTVAARVATEATVNSAAELAMHNLQNTSVPAVCARDGRGPWYLTLNGDTAAVTQTCTAIVPDLATSLDSAAYQVDGAWESILGFNQYIVGDQSGWLRGYVFGTSNLAWSLNVGGAITSAVGMQPDTDDGGHISLLVPNVSARSSCGGKCVSLYDHALGYVPTYKCDMPIQGSVLFAPSAEVAPSGFSINFPRYTFMGDSAGRIAVYVAATEGGCPLVAEAYDRLAAPIVGSPLVFTGTRTTTGGITTSVADIFVVTSRSDATWLEHWAYTERTGSTGSLAFVSNLQLAVGGYATASDPNLPVPNIGASVRQVVAGRSGALQVARISAASSGMGPTYAMSVAASGSVPPSVTRAPYWCRCPGGDLIGVGATNGALYLLTSGLALAYQYDASADGSPAINSTPVADSNNEWYFGADDGYVYDVEIPASGTQLFKAARFGPGGAIRSSPVVGSCGTGPCVYFASTTSGGYFVRLGSTRMSDLRACVTTGSGSLDCAANPRLWARVIVGPPSVVGGQGISVSGWSYYSP